MLSAFDYGGTKLEGTVHLPVLLARGQKGVREKVHNCLANIFSSAIHEISFPGEDMHWMIAAWSGFINETKTVKEVDFLFTDPSQNDTIKCQFPVNFIKDLWNWYVFALLQKLYPFFECKFCFCSIHDANSRTLELHEVRTFHTCLVKHIHNTVGLNLSAIPLVMYKTPDFELHASGKVSDGAKNKKTNKVVHENFISNF